MNVPRIEDTLLRAHMLIDTKIDIQKKFLFRKEGCDS